MDYTVWIKDEYEDKWLPHECGDAGAVKSKVLEAANQALTVRITVEVPFEIQLKIGEPGAEGRKQTGTRSKKVEETPEEVSEDETHQDKPE